jgi:hypothetical protein
MRGAKRLITPSLLVGLLAAQVIIGQRWLRSPPLAGPLVGEAFTPIEVTFLDGEGTSSALAKWTRGTCSLLVFVDPGCGICRHMRHTWPVRQRIWQDSVGRRVDIYWLSVADLESQRAFYDDLDFRGVERVQILPDRGASLRELGVYGTPISYFLDEQGRFRLGVAGDQLPPADSARIYCE